MARHFPRSLGSAPAVLGVDAPLQLAVVVDTEEEFDWTRPFGRGNRSVRSIPAQAAAHRIYDRFGLVPTYVVTHPVASDPHAAAFLKRLMREGRAEIGAHLHPWVTPPHAEPVTVRNSYHCNLPPSLERAKLEELTRTVERAFGHRPTVFKAGRYGFGRNAMRVIASLGYRVDCSFVPYASFASDGGPSYLHTPDQPFWLDADAGLLEVPLTSGFVGRLAGMGPRLQGLFDARWAKATRLTGLLSRSGLIARSRLTPEGVPAEEQCALLAAMVAAGRRFFTLTYHSPSLQLGHTPYVRSEADLEAFLGAIERVLGFFRDELGGSFTTVGRLRDSLDRIEEEPVALSATG